MSNNTKNKGEASTSVVSSAGAAMISFLGFRPGFGLAGMTHFLEAGSGREYGFQRREADIEVMT